MNFDQFGLIQKSFSFEVGSWQIEPTYWQAGAIVFLLFLLVLTLARLRYMYVHWSLGKSSISMIFWGFLLALVVEGFLIISGRTILTEIVGWENAPKPISTVLDAGRTKLVDVLGVTEEIPQSFASENPTYQSVVGHYEMLSGSEKETARFYICTPSQD